VAIGIPFPYDRLILDACCVINLYASAQMGAILRALPCTVVVADYVCEQEALMVRAGPEGSGLPAEAIDLCPLIDEGVLEVASLQDAEAATFVTLAAAFGDDGEAATAALAVHRRWALATDDRGAINVLRRQAPQIHVVSTPEIIQHWAEAIAVSPALLRAVLANVRARARYAPHAQHPLHSWWQAHC
jgi:hypothetical protein